ncbi:type I glyceraldehyde-3-phosphate dehydrogenase [Candidatus Pacearchaeota archaeon]|nr:MAG: type I glyceraldehyde-3-phosphate dehydrogenase [Candidatus Pacearchaeota archaeon]
MRVAINGFGRIGRGFLRRATEKGINVVAINSLAGPDTFAYLLKFDSVYGKFNYPVNYGKNFLKVANKKILCFNEREPRNLPWKKLDIDIVIEATGIFRDREKAAAHIKAGAKRVVISAPSDNADITIVIGVNEKKLKKSHKVISMASCTTNCLAPVAKILDDHFGITKGYMTTIHAYTNNQILLGDHHPKKRRGRAAAINLIPTTSGATKAIEQVMPSLKGKLKGLAIRAPVPCGSLVDFVALLKKSTTKEELNKLFGRYAIGKMKGILGVTSEDYVSSDIIGDDRSSVVDTQLTEANGRMVKVFSWYDNEWGYSSRLVDLIKFL